MIKTIDQQVIEALIQNEGIKTIKGAELQLSETDLDEPGNNTIGHILELQIDDCVLESLIMVSYNVEEGELGDREQPPMPNHSTDYHITEVEFAILSSERFESERLSDESCTKLELLLKKFITLHD